MCCKKTLWLLTLAGLYLLAGANGLGPGPGVFPRRRSSNDGVMQSRAVDTRVQFEVLEGEPKGTIVGFIPTKPGFTYRFNEPPREFILDPNSGEIRTNAVLDREILSNDRYDLVILSSQPTYPIEVRIIVQDINDNAPEFPEKVISVSFSESAASGTRLLLDAATDRDSGTNKVTDDYRIVNGNYDDKFRLAVTTNPSGDVSYLHLETTGKLDRETRGFYVLNISARDGGDPPKNGYLQVNVTILDVNDNPPIFDHSDYIVSLNESVTPGTPVLQVMASDSDLGDNAKITYYLSETEKQFTVDPETGVISTTEKLSCPQQNCQIITKPGGSCPKSCVFTVFARDHGSPRQDGRTYVTVNLLDTNDHAPLIKFQYFPPTGIFATVDENASNGSVVAAVSVVDMDEGLNGDTTLRIISGNELQHFRLEKTPSFDIVRVNGVLDREEIGKYNLTLVAEDKGSPPRSATSHLIIHVNDVNDHDPTFEKSEYSAVLSELAPPGTFVASITATDEDTGVNAQIYYDFVSGNNNQWFAIDSQSGLITTKSALDREVQGSIELSISARDGGPNPKWAYTQLKVTILDENDEAPQFSQSHIHVSLSENTNPNTLVAMLTAADHDQGTNGSVSYYLHSSVESNYPNMFALDTLTGQLTIKNKLDRETISQYDIKVIAKDQGIPQKSSTATVTLNVEDVNDNSPEFYPKQYFLSVPDDIAVGTTVLKVFATDRDDGENAMITYTMESGGEGHFVIDNWTGVITVRSSLRSSQKPFYKLIVSAKDRGDKRTENNAVIEIIRESKLEELEFELHDSYEFQIYEDFGNKNPKIGREVGRTKVSSSNANTYNIEYSIVLGDPHGDFKIDERTGVITTANPIDRETTASYSLTVIAKSGIAYGKTTVNISILDLNDNTPIFSQDLSEIYLLENAAVGQEIYLSKALDKDSGINSRITYSLTYNPNDQFRLSESSGVLYLNRPIRSEPGTSLQIEITATDGGEVPLSSKSTVIVIIEDVNDHTPVFDHTSYETSLLESTPVNARFFALAASDIDLGDNGIISYDIIEGNVENKFGIFPDGYLFVKSSLDRETRDYYSLTVTCSDNGKPPRSSEVPVIIHVIDENDNSPEFTNSTFTFSIAENEPIDTFVGKLTATDRDIGRNAELIFTLSNVQNDFTIDPRNGFIKTARKFDREALMQTTGQNFYTLEAIVSDNGLVRLRDKVKVKIYITDVNDNAPKFLRAPYKIQVSEGSTIGSQLIRVYTYDADEGLNGDVYYYISEGNDEEKFSIDDSTGQLILARKLDREAKSFYKLTIVAHDAALKDRLNATTTISIEVLDENDDAPEFIQTDSKISVIETTPIGTELIKFRASDADLGVNSQITYSIAAGNKRETFHIDPVSGSLFLHKMLDYEDTHTYYLNITASDGGNPRLTSTVSFVVNVLDSNDNPPNFPNTAIVRQIKEGISINTPIVTITAEDPDSGVNGKILYSIQSQDPSFGQPHFGINPSTGVIHTLREIDRETVDTFKLTVIATDQAAVESLRLTAEKLVTVIVEDVNDNAPVFVSMSAAVLPLDNFRVSPGKDGHVIMTVFARDADSSSNGLVTYELVSGNTQLFSLHRTSGTVLLKKTIENPEPRYQLAVKATDEAVQSERKSSDAYITIISRSACKNGPIFEQSALSGSVYENEPVGTSILTVRTNYASDSDIEFYVTNVTGNGKQVDRLFDIDTKLGILSTAVELDRENGIDLYEVEVYAIVTGGLPCTSSMKVKVKVMDKNDSPPVFRDLSQVFMVSEDLGVGQVVAKIRAHDPDTIGKLEYELISESEDKFLLDKFDGTLKLKDTLDRETKDVYKLVIRVTDGVQSTETTITIQVTDTNDNPPYFSEPAYSFDIPENAPRGYQVGLIAATDPDLGANSLLSYTVISDWANDVFSLNPQTGVFTLTARLDYEEVQHYILVVQAQDSGHPSLSSTVTVYCNVIDLNDNAPTFDPMSYSNEIFENVAIGTEVVSVSATDIDSGLNGKVSYTITAGDDNEDFEILSNGTIYTKELLDRETKSSYSLTITATDRAIDVDKRLSSTAQVTIILKDINDMAPVFVTSNQTSVSEGIPLNTVIMAIKAVDRDEGRNGYVEYILDVESYIPPFSLGPVDGLLRVSGRLDRETTSSYELTVTAKDRGDPPKSTKTKIFVKVLDENDNSPIFDPKQYSASVAENASIGASVLQVSATDIDEGSNGRIRYSIASGDENRDFSISEDSGIVRVAKNLNYERKNRYLLTIRAEDCAGDVNIGETKFDIAELVITISDINDNAPTFLDSPYLAYVMENVIPNDGYIITVKAYDADTPPFNSQVRYFLKEGDADLFRINASTGEISLLRALDREKQAEYVLTLVAMDTGSPPLTGTGTVRVIVQDMNDHNPEFERQFYRVSVAENLPIGTKVLTPVVTDKDIGPNALIRFSLLGDKVERFNIDNKTGVITTAVVLDREDVPIYHFTLMAQDSSVTEPRAAAVNLTITINDINDNTPAFEQSSFVVYVPDRIKPAQFVFGAKAFDYDNGINGKITYSISGKDGSRFTIDGNTGVIKTSEELSLGGANIDKVFSIVIHAADHGYESKTAKCELSVILRPAHNFPSFSYISDTQFVLPEDVPFGKVVTKILASSPKKGIVSTIKYAIAGGNIRDAVRIDSSSGEVTIGKGGLDYETSHQYEIWIEASDSDHPSLRSVMKLIINVTDTNDNAPVMGKLLYVAEVVEEEAPPQTLIKVSATDADSEENGQVTYRLVNDYESAFEIDSDTGEIFTNMRLDREDIPSYELTVEAVDQGMPQLSGVATVIVNVLDKNDNPPRFTRLFSVNVTENAEIGVFVIKITSSDLDIGENANATYSFTENPGNKFLIDPITGNVTVAGRLDREQQDEYLLKVVAVDGAWRQETPLTITIQDQNDNSPEFEHSYYSFNFPELQRNIAFVGQVSATDRDKVGPNSVISYSLQHPNDLFTIDPATGEIFSKRAIHYKRSQMESSPENMYALTVLATDNGKPPMYSECLVNINIVDANNNSPKFEKNEYLSPVPEEAQVGQRVLQVIAKDEFDYGVNSEIEYIITGGNGSNNFKINKNDGWISVSKLLALGPGASFILNVRAVDKGVPPQYDDVMVTIIITGENRFSPVFTALSYQVIVPENEPIGSTILIVSATDNDDGPNGMIRYSISGGNERKEFYVDTVTGTITILQPLDYDSIQEYHLNITAEDLAFRPKAAVAMLRITLTDINDNAPVFNQTEYHASLPENSPVNSFVYKAVATDKDSPKNAIIQYAIEGSSVKDLFSIEPSTGVIKSKVVFDYEEKNLFSIIVVATNPDSQMFGKTKITIHITGVNEYYPKFIQSVFHFDVSESAEVGTVVGSIQASDKDSGDDGKVYYLLVGSSNDKGFVINPQTGKISVSRNLDRETQSRVVLTVMAKNFGGIRGNDTDEAQVIISIQDGNDPPEFVSDQYEASISEGASIGTKVLTVKAVDKDVRPQNNQFSYSIIGGNSDYAFKIDPQNGNIETSRKLDRETIPTYSLIVGAIDAGTPPQTGTTSVKITVNDINDNGPTFSPNNLKGSVSENEPANTSIMTLTATDPDLPPNGAPFSYYLIGGKHKSLVTVEKHSGVMRTTRMIDRETTPLLEVMVEVEDSGKPQMRSQHNVIINVLDQNDSPSIPRVAHVLVYNFNDKIPIGKIADVHPNDPDTTGNYKCSILNSASKTNVANSLVIPQGCDLHSTLSTKPQGYSLSVSGNDGKHPDVMSTISVEFSNFYNKSVENSIAIKMENITASNFLQNYYRSFLDILKASLENGDDLILYSIKESNQDVKIFLAVKHVSGYRNPSYILERIRKKRDALSQLINSKLVIGYSPCNSTTCNNGGACSEKINVRNELKIVDSPNFIFTSPLVTYDFICKCMDGLTGDRCEKRQNPCMPNPCQAGGECRRQGYDFQCTCPPGREGKLCQSEKSDACSINPCKNGGSCRESSDGSSFFCLCRPGYRGNQCETIADSCRPNPCLNGGLCVSLKPGYKCSCIDGRYGRHCERATYGFQELSYMSFPALDSATNDISIIFATTKPDVLLIYNYGVQSGGRSDFVSMEILGGKAVFSYGGARTAITSIVVGKYSNETISDGKWHKVTATRNGKVMSLSTAKCFDNGDTCEECRPGDRSCYSSEIGPTGTLNFNKHPLIVGGLLSADPVLERPGQVHSDDFIGCVHSVSVNGKTLNLSNPMKSRGIQPTCNRNNNGGPCSQGHPDDPALSLCGAFGKCIDRWNTAICKCGSYLLSQDCYTSIEPISLIEGGFVEFKISEKHRRMQLLEYLYDHTNMWNHNEQKYNKFMTRISNNTTDYETENFPKSMSLMFRTVKENGVILYAATNKHFTLIELKNGKISYKSAQNTQINMTLSRSEYLANGKWHNVTIVSLGRVAKIMINGKFYGDELDTSIVHDFLDPYLTVLSLGGIRRDLYRENANLISFEGCISNFTINNEIQPFNGSGSIFKEVLHRGKVFVGCHSLTGLVESPVTDPLNIGITLVIVFFVILLVAIFASFLVFRLRKQHKEKHGGASPLHSKQNGTSTLLGGAGLVSSSGSVDMGRGLHVNDLSGVGFHSDGNDILRGVGHHLVGPELISKKYKEREIVNSEPQRPQRPDIIEREVVSKSPPPHREDIHPPLPPPSQSHHPHDHLGNIDQGSEFPEHYDLENASSIAPSDIDIVYHYKGYREAGNVRKYKATPPPVASYTHHKHQSAAAQHRHSPHHAGPYTPRAPPQSSQPPSSNTPRPHQSTPLARLSPSSELSSQQPRILTLHDISGKPLQSALLATTSSGVGKDVLHSNSERSLNSPVMSQLSGQSSSTSRNKNPGAPQKTVQSVPVPMGLTAEEIERINARPRTSSLVSTLDAVSSSSEAPRVPGPHLAHMHHSPAVDAHSSSSSSESGNDSFTCSEIEYDNNSVNGDKYPKPEERNVPGHNENGASTSGKPMIPPPSYDGFDSSFRGSLSTLVASDDDISPHMGGIYRQPNGTTSPSTSTLGWDYLLNWGPNFESLIGVFKDIAELPDTVNVNGRVMPSSLRIPASVQNPSEEYV